MTYLLLPSATQFQTGAPPDQASQTLAFNP